MASEAIRKLRYVYSVEGDQKVIQSSKQVEGAISDQESNIVSLQKRYDELASSQQKLITQQNQTTQATAAANDNNAEWSRGLAETAEHALTLAGHLKLVAAGAYLAVPAFRQLTNQAAVAGLGQIASRFGLVGDAAGLIGRALGPAVSFVTRLSVPILAAVAAWEVLNSVIQKGNDLLTEFGTESQRQKYSPSGVDERLAELTKFQQNTLSLDQERRAGELAKRLEDATFQLKEFARIQFDLTEPALHLQSIWVRIVELIASAATNASKIILPGQFQVPAGAGTPFVDPMSGAIIGGTVDAQGNLVGSAKGSALGVSNRALREQGLERLQRAMTGGFAGRFAGIVPERETQKKEVAAAASEFDRLANSIERSTAAVEADAQTVGKSAGEVMKLRTELRLWESAQQEVLKTGGNLDDYADRIERIAERAARAADRLEKAREGFQAAGEFSRSLTTNLTSGLADIAMGAKTAGDAFKDFGNVVERALIQMILKVTLFNQLEKGLTSAITPLLPGAAATPSPGPVQAPVTFAAGGVISRRTVFPMAGGLGLAGEAGPEAVMPLTRDARGRLGVASGGGSVVNVQVVNNGAPASATTQQSRGADGALNLKVILDQMEGRLADNVRRGRGPLPSAMSGRFGLNPARGNVA